MITLRQHFVHTRRICERDESEAPVNRKRKILQHLTFATIYKTIKSDPIHPSIHENLIYHSYIRTNDVIPLEETHVVARKRFWQNYIALILRNCYVP